MCFLLYLSTSITSYVSTCTVRLVYKQIMIKNIVKNSCNNKKYVFTTLKCLYNCEQLHHSE